MHTAPRSTRLWGSPSSRRARAAAWRRPSSPHRPHPSLSRQLALELGPFGVAVNSVAPGFVRSNPASEAQWQAYGAEGQARLREATFLRRLGTVEDIADAVLWLASDASGWVTGQVLSVDGGRA